mgnify:CR=1 FL=1
MKTHLLILFLLIPVIVFAQDSQTNVKKTQPTIRQISLEIEKRNSFAGEVLASTRGFGLGIFYRKVYTQNLSANVNFSISSVKDDDEVTYYDYYGNSVSPGKINRFMLMPLLFGIEHRLFSEEIVGTFRPFINAGAGLTMIYSSPAQEEFFTSLKYGKMYYSFAGYIGAGAYFGNRQESLLGINVRFLFAPFNNGIESLEIPSNLVNQTKKKSMKEFGGLYITFSFGSNYD